MMRHGSLKAGDVFGRLTVVSYSHSVQRKDGSAGERVMNCTCQCGNSIKARTSNLKSGNTKSCGCLQQEATIKSNKMRADKVDHHA